MKYSVQPFGQLSHSRRWRGLNARVSMLFAAASLVLAALTAYFTYSIVRSELITDFESSATIQFADNATETISALGSLPEAQENPETITAILVSLNQKLSHSNASDSLLVLEGSGLRLSNRDRSEIPEAMTQTLQQPQAGTVLQYYAFGASKRMIIGARLSEFNPDIEADYFEIHDLTELDNTLTGLRNVLVFTAMLASVAGAAVGLYSGRKVLSPIARISHAAQDIARGNFQTRLDLQVDPDLEVLSSSFNEMVDKLRERIERDQRFTSDVSHELRSPLMTLTASAEVLEKNSDDMNHASQRAVQLMKEDLARFSQLVDDLLEISKVDAGAAILQPSSVVVREFLANITSRFDDDLVIRHPQRDLDLVITADKRRLHQIMTNLLNNAKKYAGGATGLFYRKIGNSVQITVEDDGPGVPPKDRIRIFERFSRSAADAGNRSAATGVGLGLALVAEHVRLHGGRVWVSDRIDGNRGSRFVVELPLGDPVDTNEEMAT